MLGQDLDLPLKQMEYVHKKQRLIQNLAKHLSWSFL